MKRCDVTGRVEDEQAPWLLVDCVIGIGLVVRVVKAAQDVMCGRVLC